MKNLLRILTLLCAAALLFLLHYAWLHPSPKHVITDDLYAMQAEGISWQRYHGTRIVQQVEAARATMYFTSAAQGGTLDFSVMPARIELCGDVQFASEGHVLRTTQATYEAGKLFGNAAVEIEGEHLRLHGREGFTYVLAEEQLALLGEIAGEARPAERPSQ